jgi:hypothetical protein
MFESMSLQVVAGILASVEGKQLVSDESWKCTTRYVPKWMSASLDDDSWPDAVISGTNSDLDIHKLQPLIDSTAKWIWTSKHADPQIDSTVYCRGYIGMTVDGFAVGIGG